MLFSYRLVERCIIYPGSGDIVQVTIPHGLSRQTHYLAQGLNSRLIKTLILHTGISAKLWVEGRWYIPKRVLHVGSIGGHCLQRKNLSFYIPFRKFRGHEEQRVSIILAAKSSAEIEISCCVSVSPYDLLNLNYILRVKRRYDTWPESPNGWPLSFFLSF